MWRYLFLALTTFVCGFFLSLFSLDPREVWQIPAAVGLAVYLALHVTRVRRMERATVSDVEQAVGVSKAVPTLTSAVLGGPLDELRSRIGSIVEKAAVNAEFRVWIIYDHETTRDELRDFISEIFSRSSGGSELKCLLTVPDEATASRLVIDLDDLAANVVVAAFDHLSGEYPFVHRFDLIVVTREFGRLAVGARVELLRRLKAVLAVGGHLAVDGEAARRLRPSQWRRERPGIFCSLPLPREAERQARLSRPVRESDLPPR